MRFSKQPYKIVNKVGKGFKMADTVGQVLTGTGIAYRKQDRGQYVIDHVPSGYYIIKIEGSEALARLMCFELSRCGIDFTKSQKEVSTKENKIIVKAVIFNIKGISK